MNEFRADLHCHSHHSDGSSSPIELLAMASKIGLQGLSITDHDTIAAYENIEREAERYNIKLLSGAEFSTFHRGTSVHILAYGFNLQNHAIHNLCKNHQLSRIARMKEMIYLLSQQGMAIDEKGLLKKQGSIGRPHLAEALVQNGYVQSIQEAFNKFLGDGKPCFVPSNNISTEETLKIIKKAHAFAIIAHPHIIKNQSILLELLDMDFDGIEAYYAQFSSDHEKPWIKIANNKHWIITGGSDYHGTIKPNPLGSSWIDKERFDPLYVAYQKNKIL